MTGRSRPEAAAIPGEAVKVTAPVSVRLLLLPAVAGRLDGQLSSLSPSPGAVSVYGRPFGRARLLISGGAPSVPRKWIANHARN